jgi:Double-GTPase 2
MSGDLMGLALMSICAALISPLVILPRALRHVWDCGWRYVASFCEVLGIPEASKAAPPPVPPQHYSKDGREPAYEHYLFGQARRDLNLALSRVVTRFRRDFSAEARQIVNSRLTVTGTGYWTMPVLWHMLIGLMFMAGLVLGTLTATLLLAAATAIQVLIVIIVAWAGISATFALRVIDSALLRIRGIRMTCPNCYRHISYPSYRCPDCGVLHHDIRPGRYGVLRRHCVCGRSLPTLLLLGSHQMTAFCPFEGCEVQLADDQGTAAELTVAIFGGPNAGKTRLLTVMVMALKDRTAQQTAVVNYADRVTARRVSELTPAVFSNLPTPRTGPDQPRAYSLYIKPADRKPRLVHFFDTAGEKFYDSGKLTALRYFRLAGTFIFVIDPLSIDGVWDKLTPSRQSELSPRAGHSPTYVFQQVVRNVEEMGVDLKHVRLGVAVSKADMLSQVELPAPSQDSASVEKWLEEMNLDDLVRSIRHAFDEVRFFHTSAMLTDSSIPAAIDELIDWILTGSGLTHRADGGDQ